MPQQGHARRVQVDADEVDATGDDRLERLLELLGVDVVLVEPDADILRLDLDQLGERVLEPAADRDAAAAEVASKSGSSSRPTWLVE